MELDSAASVRARWESKMRLFSELAKVCEKTLLAPPEKFESIARRAMRPGFASVAYAALATLSTLPSVESDRRRLARVKRQLREVEKIYVPRRAAERELEARFGADTNRSPADQPSVFAAHTLVASIFLGASGRVGKTRVVRLEHLRADALAAKLFYETLIADLFLLSEYRLAKNRSGAHRIYVEICRLEKLHAIRDRKGELFSAKLQGPR